jgi:hypothetical protein
MLVSGADGAPSAVGARVTKEPSKTAMRAGEIVEADSS